MTKIKTISAILAGLMLIAASLWTSAPAQAQTSQQKQLVGKPVGGLSRSLNNDDGKQKTWKERREETRQKMKNKRKHRKDRAANSNSEEQRTASTDSNTQSRTKTTNKQQNQRKAAERRANNRQAQKAGNNNAGKNLND